MSARRQAMPGSLALLGGAGRPRTCDRAVMSRFPVVQRIGPSVVLAGQVRCPVCLVASCLAGCVWWNDRENDRQRSSLEDHQSTSEARWNESPASGACSSGLVTPAPLPAGRPTTLASTRRRRATSSDRGGSSRAQRSSRRSQPTARPSAARAGLDAEPPGPRPGRHGRPAPRGPASRSPPTRRPTRTGGLPAPPIPRATRSSCGSPPKPRSRSLPTAAVDPRGRVEPLRPPDP
jgi:hypothetical protein